VITLEIKIGACDELGEVADKLKRNVFIDEQGVPEEEVFDLLGFQATHIVVFDTNTPIATASVLNDGDNWYIKFVAVDKRRRGQHLGEKVMQVAIEYIKSYGGKQISLTAQQQVRGFYEKLGFVQNGELEVFESGFVLIPMKLYL
jgi:predicted GNAT family N-acyltransferase